MKNEAIDRQLAKAQQQADREQGRDLALILCNDGDIYRQSIKPTITNLQKKIKKGNFDETQSIQAFYNIVVSALKNPRFNRYYTYDIKMVDVPTRYYTAVELAEHFSDELFDIAEE